MKWINIYS